MQQPWKIVIRGAREHNLKGVDLTLPRQSLVVITGRSGSGKSSLAHDTIFKEGQRRFMESLSAYARQFLGQMDKPDVEHIEGLSPTISIDQKTVNRNPRSTVGTITEIYDHLRLLFARLGTPHCPHCGRVVSHQTAERITRSIYLAASTHPQKKKTRPSPPRGMILAPIVKDRKGEYRKELAALREDGYRRARIDGRIRSLDEEITLDRYVRHTIEVVLDRVVFDSASRGRVTDAVERAIEMGGGVVSAIIGDRHLTYGTTRACPDCGISIPEMEPRLFSFNSPHGACPECGGLGERVTFDPALIVPDDQRSIRDGAIRCLTQEDRRIPFSRFGLRHMAAILEEHGCDLDTPWRHLPHHVRHRLLFGDDRRKAATRNPAQEDSSATKRRHFDGIIPALARGYRYTHADFLEAYRSHTPCRACEGKRLNPVALAVTFRGRNIWDLSAMAVDDALRFFDRVELSPVEDAIGRGIIQEIGARLMFLQQVGLGYLTLDRAAGSLAGGEAQRIRLARQVGSGLQGVLYVLDEPSIGLHPRDNRRLLDILCRLRDIGNTVIVVEHDRETMERADYLVDIGPGAGREGGRITARGAPDKVVRSRSLTGRYLRGEVTPTRPRPRRRGNGKRLVLKGASHHNLKHIDVTFPLGTFIVVTGVSGSGKSTLVSDILHRALAQRLHRTRATPGTFDALEGAEFLDKVIEIDQAPIGRTPRSNPATYTKVFDHIRALYAKLPESRLRGYSKSRFSFNLPGGRCEVCQGAGVKTIEMQFLADVQVPCEACHGKRFNHETLSIRYRGKHIADVLEMTVAEAADFFANQPNIHRTLEVMASIGLGYVTLGQPSTTLSGGEAQRIKLASELRRPATGKTLYILDEPTTGLHAVDIQALLEALQRLVDSGNTVLVIEHNLDVVLAADHIIDLGPEGGAHGGSIVATGTPEQVAGVQESHTGRFLKTALKTPPVRSPHTRPTPAPTPRRRRRRSADLVVQGASKHNLKHIDVSIPANKFTVITGVSGSGKTSLALDTLFVAGQQRYVESLSTYARRFLGRMETADVDRIDGLSPAISVDQKTAPHNPRSTVGTSTEIHDYLRLLFARAGTPHCPSCGAVLTEYSPRRAAQTLLDQCHARRGEILAPLPPSPPTPPGVTALENRVKARLHTAALLEQGFLRVRVDDILIRLDDENTPDILEGTWGELVVDRMVLHRNQETRLTEAFEAAFAKGDGVAWFRRHTGERHGFSAAPACLDCGVRLLEPLSPRAFSFNSHVGACPACDGLGMADGVVVEHLIPRPRRPLLAGAMDARAQALLNAGGAAWLDRLQELAGKMEIPLDRAWQDLGEQSRNFVLHGEMGQGRGVNQATANATPRRPVWPGLIPLLEAWYRHPKGAFRQSREEMKAFIRPRPCRVCGGTRLKPLPLAVRVGGRNIAEVSAMTVADAIRFFDTLALPPEKQPIARQILREIGSRLRFLRDVGLDYLTLNRASNTLSGGESQRIRLASQLGAHLAGVLYVLDEPTVGLHPRDTDRLLTTLKGLRDRGNTVVVVEHDAQTIEAADHVIDLGPGAGVRGGEVVARGTPKQLARNRKSLTGAYLSGRRTIPVPSQRRQGTPGVMVRGARENNLKTIDAHFPLGALVCVTGVSGSGKSTLVMDVLAKALARRLAGSLVEPGAHAGLTVPADVVRVSIIDQSPLGRTPRSSPATYTGVLDPIRDLFASLPDSRMRGYAKGRFSFNIPGGRCEACEGRGAIRVEMHFLSDVWVPCEECGGKRYNARTLEVRFKGKSIADVLDMEVSEALEFFTYHPPIRRLLEPLQDVGLGYMKVGQPATTMSGGEAQRVKLASALTQRRGKGFYILDEPTTGLHFQDVEMLMDVLQKLVSRGNTVVVIEHNPDVMKGADHIIDLGPEGGARGGWIVAEGTPETVAEVTESHTGQALRHFLPARS